MKTFILISTILVLSVTLWAQEFSLDATGVFQPPPAKKVLLFSRPKDDREIVLFYSKLRVNTDGAPTSYHPYHLNGTAPAINTICNGIAVYKLPRTANDKKLKCDDAVAIFTEYRTSGWVVPKDHEIKWDSVLAPIGSGKNIRPCLFTSGDYAGFLGSLTSVKAGVPTGQRGECEYRNQLDARIVPHLVRAKRFWTDARGVVHENPVYKFGVREKEDLVFAYNPQNGAWSYAIVGDIGPNDNLGEGSVALNGALLRQADGPKDYRDAKKRFDTDSTKIMVAIIPDTKSFRAEIAKPYTKEKIETRGKLLLAEMGFADEQRFIDFLRRQLPLF